MAYKQTTTITMNGQTHTVISESKSPKEHHFQVQSLETRMTPAYQYNQNAAYQANSSSVLIVIASMLIGVLLGVFGLLLFPEYLMSILFPLLGAILGIIVGSSLFAPNTTIAKMNELSNALPDMPVLHLYINVHNNYDVQNIQKDWRWYTPYLRQVPQDVRGILEQANTFVKQYNVYSKQYSDLYRTLSPSDTEQAKKKLITAPDPYYVIHGHFCYFTPSGNKREYVFFVTLKDLREWYAQHQEDVVKHDKRKKIITKSITKQELMSAARIQDKYTYTPSEILDGQNIPNVTGVYVLHNLTKNICYVGQAKSTHKRLLQHLRRDGCAEAYDDYQHGDKFLITIHPFKDDNFDTLDAQERYYIAKHDSYHNGYNKTSGNHD